MVLLLMVVVEVEVGVGAAAIFNHPVLPRAELVAFDGCCIII